MTRSSPSQTRTALKRPSSSPVKRPLTQKESPSYSSYIWYRTMESPRRSSLTETLDSPPSSRQNFVASSTFDKTSAQHITPKQMAPVSALTNHSNSTSTCSAERNRTTGTLGYHLHNTPRTLGHQLRPRKP